MTSDSRAAAPSVRALRRPAPGAGIALAGLTVALVVSITVAAMIGPVTIPPGVVWEIVGHRLGLPVEESWTRPQESIVWTIRLPRVLLAAVVGAGLSVVGVAIQALVRNALADPYVLGVSSGASVGATVILLFGGLSALGVYALSAGAFLGALGAIVVVFAVAQQHGRLSPLRLILSGVSVAYVLSAATSFLLFQAPDAESVRSVLFWLLGSFAQARWSYLTLPAIAVLAGCLLMLARARWLNALVMGDDTAATLGVDVRRFAPEVFLIVSLMTGAIVAVSGAIGFVGLMMPHAVRLLVGADHRRVLPLAALLGASFMIWVDVVARTLVAPEELPVGVITALLGGPFFVLLMRSGRIGLRSER